MPSTRRTPHMRRESWPSRQDRLHQSNESLIDDDPINSYLSPTPLLDDGDTDDEVDMDLDMDMEMDMAFDAGIEDYSRPMPIIRQISPSTLNGSLRSPPPRTTTPPHLRFGSYSPPSRNSPEVSTPNTDIGKDDYDDGEDYVRLSPSHPGGFRLAVPNYTFGKPLDKTPRSAKSAAIAAAKAEEKEEDRVALMMARGSSYNDDDEYLFGSPAFHVGRPKMAPANRGRSTKAAPPRLSLSSRPRSWSGVSGYGSGRLSPRAWLQPSPDVWSIEEEDEAEISEMDLDAPADQGERVKKERKGKGRGKKVRFALPVRVDIP